MNYLHRKAVGLLKSSSKKSRRLNTSNSGRLITSKSHKSPFQSNTNSKDWNISKTLVSLGSEGYTDTKMSITNVSTKMFLKHLHNPVKKEDLFENVTKTDT